RRLVDADDLMAEVRKARARNQPHIAGADHCDVHARRSCCNAPVEAEIRFCGKREGGAAPDRARLPHCGWREALPAGTSVTGDKCGSYSFNSERYHDRRAFKVTFGTS